MKDKLNVISMAGLLAFALVALPEIGYAQRSGVEIWSQNCGRCHGLQPANRYTADQWDTIMEQMKLQARLTDDDSKAILEFLKGGAKKLALTEQAPSEPVVLTELASTHPVIPATFTADSVAEGKALYEQSCVACHGKEGKGNGPVAAALNPPPPDMSKKDFQTDHTDKVLQSVISKGKETMPGFGTRLTPAQIRALVLYIRTLQE